jgi:NAD(P)-dependent dehydrogenase (short-subunit alcohol dehydrogenase family)
MDPTALLRPGLLDGRTIALGGGGPFAPSLTALGATPATLPATADEDEATAHAQAAVAAHGALDGLVHDLRPAFGAGGHAGLRATLDVAWATIRAVANAAWIEPGRAGALVLVAPPPGGPPRPEAEGVRGAAENIARTLSIEWARFSIGPVAITPGARTTDGELAALAAYLVSPAGAYFSGTRLALGEVAETPSAG